MTVAALGRVGVCVVQYFRRTMAEDSRHPVVVRTFKALLLIIAVSAALHLVTRWVPLPGGRALLNLDGDVSFPSWYSSLQLAAAAGALTVMAWMTRRDGRPGWRYWGLMAVVVLYLSMDEALVLHEQLTTPMRALTGASSGPMLFAWVIPAAAVTSIIGLVLLRFVMAQGKRFGRSVLIAGFLYVGGAVGLEVVAGALLSLPQTPLIGVAIELEIALEESMEMAGVAVLLCATLESILDSSRPIGRVKQNGAMPSVDY